MTDWGLLIGVMGWLWCCGVVVCFLVDKGGSLTVEGEGEGGLLCSSCLALMRSHVGKQRELVMSVCEDALVVNSMYCTSSLFFLSW